MEYRTDLKELLEYINPTGCTYQEWTSVGMALKHEGYPVDVWDDWSSRDYGRYHAGECARKWNTFNESSYEIVTGGTIYQLAIDNGWQPDKGHELEWGAEISNEGIVVDSNWIENREVHEPDKWNPVQQITEYLETLFEPAENVGYVMQSYLDEKKGKYIPQNKGSYDRSAGTLIEKLKKCGGDIGAVLGDYDPNGGAWIRFNPLDGNGVNNTNVTEFRYALVESDDMEIEKQNAIIRELELPVAILVHSGGKSLHAIVRIDASDYTEYKKRVDYLYDICKKNGMVIDTQNRNPSRLSRLPGVQRGDHKQFIVDKNIGKSSWNEWKEWIEAVNDNLPDFEDLGDIWNDMPELAPELIKGVLRNGHKMLLAGPSKAGKSFLQIELAISIAEGRKWLSFPCAQGRVLYVNLELDRASCLHRFRDVYQALDAKPVSIRNIDIWNLRGKAVPMDQLVPKLVRRARNGHYAAIIIDPIYKVITGDENSAEQMAKFCNQFDRICAELGCAVIYCHHHSKGAQGGKKSMDRASGSGVFARDPDAQLDMIELPVSDALRQQQVDRAVCDEIINDGWLRRAKENYEDDLGQDDLLVAKTLINYVENNIKDEFVLNNFHYQIGRVQQRETTKTAWQIDATLREFPGFNPINVWFEYPIHRIDEADVLKDVKPEEEKPYWERAKENRKKEAEKNRNKKHDEFVVAFNNLAINGDPVKMQDLANNLNVTVKTLGEWFRKNRYKVADEYERYQDSESDYVYVRTRAVSAVDHD